jgi:hypothetical protein
MSSEDEGHCSICLEQLEPQSDTVHLCHDKSHPGNCRECVVNYIKNKIESAFLGTCPAMYCPHQHAKGKGRAILNYREWSKLVPANDLSRYSSLADSVLAFLCGGCHSLKSLQIKATPDQVEEAERSTKLMIEHAGGKELYESFCQDLFKFENGEERVEVFYSKLSTSYFSSVLVAGNDQEVWRLMKTILRLISDPERRASLHLRYLKIRPRIWTPCCSREHCFKCRTKDFHDGKTCDGEWV